MHLNSYAEYLNLFLRIRSMNDCHFMQQQLQNFANWYLQYPPQELLFVDYELLDTSIDCTAQGKDLILLHIFNVLDKASWVLVLDGTTLF